MRGYPTVVLFAAVVLAIPAAAYASSPNPVAGWMAHVMGGSSNESPPPPGMTRMMQAPGMRRMMQSPGMRRMMQAPGMGEMMRHAGT